MQVPRLLCGRSKPVASVWRKQIAKLARGEPWIDRSAELIAASDAPGLVMLNGPSPLLGGEDHVHAYAPLWELGKAFDAAGLELDAVNRALDASLDEPWAILGLLSQANYRWL